MGRDNDEGIHRVEDACTLRALALRVPDMEIWIDLRGPLLEGSARVFGAEGPNHDAGFVLRSTNYPYAAVFGRPVDAVVQRVAEAGRGVEDFRVLAASDAGDWLRHVLPGWPSQEVHLHRRPAGLDGRGMTTPTGVEVEILENLPAAEQGVFVERVTASVRAELRLALARGKPLAVVRVEADGEPREAAFCYAAFRTETLWDVAVETLPGFRRRGLATWGFEVLAGALRDRGLAPVWGAYDDNPASLALAAKLGFRVTARLVALRPPGDPG